MRCSAFVLTCLLCLCVPAVCVCVCARACVCVCACVCVRLDSSHHTCPHPPFHVCPRPVAGAALQGPKPTDGSVDSEDEEEDEEQPEKKEEKSGGRTAWYTTLKNIALVRTCPFPLPLLSASVVGVCSHCWCCLRMAGGAKSPGRCGVVWRKRQKVRLPPLASSC